MRKEQNIHHLKWWTFEWAMMAGVELHTVYYRSVHSVEMFWERIAATARKPQHIPLLGKRNPVWEGLRLRCFPMQETPSNKTHLSPPLFGSCECILILIAPTQNEEYIQPIWHERRLVKICLPNSFGLFEAVTICGYTTISPSVKQTC
jgi:hypothetical protein